jgi:hypothetical protein
MFRQTAVITDLAAARGFINIKRASLLFDKIVVLKTEESELDPTAKDRPIPGIEPAEVHWLTENGILSFEEDLSRDLFKGNDPAHKEYRDYRIACLGNLALSRRNSPSYESTLRAGANFITRYSATLMQERTDEDQRTIPLLYDPKYELTRLGATIRYPYAAEDKANYSRTTAIVLSQFPVPDDLTSWQDIFEFRKDNENQLAFFVLRDWINRAIQVESSAAELKDKIEWEIGRTEAALKRARIKHNYQQFETVVTSGVGFLENLLKIRWSKATEAAFSVGKSHIDMLTEEAKIAENGLYYVVKAKEIFGEQR